MRPLPEELAALRAEIARVVVGYRSTVDDLLTAALCGGHVLLEGVPGVAKTTLARTFADAMGIAFHRIQFTQDLLPADITGHYFFNQKTKDFDFRRGAIFTDLLLADEINRAPPKTQSALLEAMEERQVTVEGATMPLPPGFTVVATMNPVDMEGVYRLPEAQLDRFLIRSRMGYLPREDERRMLLNKLGDARAARPAVGPDFLPRARAAVREVHVDESIVDYLHAVCLATRSRDDVVLGASPRAAEKLLRASQAHALLDGRGFVIPDDVKSVVSPILNHRILLSAEAEMAGIDVDRVLAEAVAATPLPAVDVRKR